MEGVLPGLAVALLFEIAFLVVVGALSRGRIRVLGLAAGALWVVGTLINQLLVPLLVTEADWPMSSIGLVATLSSLLHWAALALVAIALVVGGRAEVAQRRRGTEPERPAGPSQSQPWAPGHSQAWGQGQSTGSQPSQPGSWQQQPPRS